jgi:hypothetical protein
MESTLAQNPLASNDHGFPLILMDGIASSMACAVQLDTLASGIEASAEAAAG